MKPIRKAVFPVAGLGTRFLPATKAIPKEMLPVVDRPLIQYAVDEAREAGIEQMIFVTGRGKSAIEDHFDIAFELEKTMSERGKNLSVLEPTRLGPGNEGQLAQLVTRGDIEAAALRNVTLAQLPEGSFRAVADIVPDWKRLTKGSAPPVLAIALTRTEVVEERGEDLVKLGRAHRAAQRGRANGRGRGGTA